MRSHKQRRIVNYDRLSAWPKPSKVKDTDNYLPYITVHITLLLSQIALYTERILSNFLFLENGITYNNLVRWFDLNQSLFFSENPDESKILPILKIKSNNIHKIPTFRVPNFKGDTLTGNDFIANVVIAFRSSNMAQFLGSTQCCNNSLTCIQASGTGCGFGYSWIFSKQNGSWKKLRQSLVTNSTYVEFKWCNYRMHYVTLVGNCLP